MLAGQKPSAAESCTPYHLDLRADWRRWLSVNVFLVLLAALSLPAASALHSHFGGCGLNRPLRRVNELRYRASIAGVLLLVRARWAGWPAGSLEDGLRLLSLGVELASSR